MFFVFFSLWFAFDYSLESLCVSGYCFWTRRYDFIEIIECWDNMCCMLCMLSVKVLALVFLYSSTLFIFSNGINWKRTKSGRKKSITEFFTNLTLELGCEPPPYWYAFLVLPQKTNKKKTFNQKSVGYVIRINRPRFLRRDTFLNEKQNLRHRRRSVVSKTHARRKE